MRSIILRLIEKDIYYIEYYFFFSVVGVIIWGLLFVLPVTISENNDCGEVCGGFALASITVIPFIMSETTYWLGRKYLKQMAHNYKSLPESEKKIVEHVYKNS